MSRYATWTILPCVLLLVAGCKTDIASECDGWQRLNPSSATRAFIIGEDRGFANEVASHNTFGQQRGCW